MNLKLGLASVALQHSLASGGKASSYTFSTLKAQELFADAGGPDRRRRADHHFFPKPAPDWGVMCSATKPAADQPDGLARSVLRCIFSRS